MSRKAHTLGTIWEDFAVRRRSQVRDWQNDEGRWELYIAPDPIAHIPLAKLARRDVKAWLGRMQRRGLATQTLKNALTLLRVVCSDAVESELLAWREEPGVKLAEALVDLTRDALDRSITPQYIDRLRKASELLEGGRRVG